MANAIELKITVDSSSGEAVIKKMNSSVKSMTSTMSSSMASAATKMRASINSISLDKLITSIKVGLVAAFAAVTVAIGKSITAFASFSKELTNVSTLGTYDMGQFKDALLAIPAELGKTTELTQGLYQALSAGVEPAEAIGLVTKAATAAKAGLSSTFTAVDAGTTILNAFGLEADQAGKVYDIMFGTVKAGKTTFEELASSVGKAATIASTAGVSVEEFHAGIASLTKSGLGTSEAVNSLKAAFSNIIKPTTEAQKIAKELGIQFDSSALKTQGFSGFLDSLVEATGGNVDSMAKLFGSTEALTAVLALTKEEGLDFKEILDQLKDSSGAAQEAFEKQKVTISALWETFQTLTDKILILMGSAFAPYIEEVLKQVNKWLEANSELIKQNMPEIIQGIGDAIQTVIGVIEFFHKSWLGIKLVVSSVVAAIIVSIDGLVSALRFVLLPIDLILQGLKAIGIIDTNPFDTLQDSLDELSISTTEYVAKTATDLVTVGQSYDAIQGKVDQVQQSVKNIATSSTETKDSMLNDQGFIKEGWTGVEEKLSEPIKVALETEEAIEKIVEVKKETEIVQTVIEEEVEININTNAALSALSQVTAAMSLLQSAASGLSGGSSSSYGTVAEGTALTKGMTGLGGFDKYGSFDESGAYDIVGDFPSSDPHIIGEKDYVSHFDTGAGYEDIPNIVGFASGTGLKGLPYTGLFKGHAGEIVKNPAESEAERAGAGGNTYNISIAPQFMSGDSNSARLVASEIQRELDQLSLRRA